MSIGAPPQDAAKYALGGKSLIQRLQDVKTFRIAGSEIDAGLRGGSKNLPKIAGIARTHDLFMGQGLRHHRPDHVESRRTAYVANCIHRSRLLTVKEAADLAAAYDLRCRQSGLGVEIKAFRELRLRMKEAAAA